MENKKLLDEARELAKSHYEIDPLTTKIVLFPSKDNNRINLLEVTSDVPPSGCLFPISFVPDKDMEYPRSIILVAQEDYEKIKNGEILLPEDWGKQDRGQEIAKEK